MEISRDTLLELAFEDWSMRAKWLRVWTKMAKEELEHHEKPWEPVYGLLFWAQTEARRRRTYLLEFIPELGGEIPETELEAIKTLRALEARREELSGKKKKDAKKREP